MVIDTHSHVQFPAYNDDRDGLIAKTLAENVWMINVGTKYQTSVQAVELAEKYESGVYAAIGLHPMHAGAEFLKQRHDENEESGLELETTFDKEKYLALAKSKKVVAIGEIGLDYYYKPKSATKLAEFKAKQKQVFMQQLDFAKELDLPIIIHCRMAHQDLLEILKSYILNHKSVRGVVHCFTGNLEEMRQYVALGFHIGLNGIMFKLNLDEVVKTVPMENMLLETDCPYLTPSMAESQRNEPLFMSYTIQKIAELKGVSVEEVVEATTQNARKLFNI